MTALTETQRIRDIRTRIGSRILRSLNADERAAMDHWLAEAIGTVVEDELASMDKRWLADAISGTAAEYIGHELGMEYPHENANAGCDPITM
jgi:hypothetical protein